MDFLKSDIYKIAHLSSIICLLLPTGCAHYRASPHYSAPKPLPKEVSEYYSYQKAPIAANIESVKKKNGYLIKKLRLDSSGAKVVIEFFQANRKTDKSPCLLILPILGGKYPIEKEFAEFFTLNGLNCALIHRQKYKKIQDEGPESMEKTIRQTVINNRVVIDYLLTQENIDPLRLGTFGISLGGINAAISAAVEPRLKAHIIALAGGHIADILRDTRDPALTKPIKEYIQKHNITMDDFYAEVKKTIKSDPLYLAEHIDARKVLMFVAVFDKTLTRKNGVRLWQAIGKPEIIYIPLGHYSSYFAKEYVKAKSLQFYKKTFNLK